MKSVLICILVALLCHATGYANIVSNAGFEQAISINPADDHNNWYAFTNSTHSSIWEMHSGSQAAIIEGTWEGTPDHGGLRQKVDIVAGETYALDFYYFWDNGFTAAQHTLSLHWLDGNSNVLSSVVNDIDTGHPAAYWNHPGWHNFIKAPLTAPAGAALCELNFEFSGIGDRGSFYIDDIVFTNDRLSYFDQDYAVAAGTRYHIDFEYKWDTAFWAQWRMLDVAWLDDVGAVICRDQYPVNVDGNADIWHHSGRYTLSAPSAAVTARVSVATALIDNMGVFQVANLQFAEVNDAIREMGNNSFEMDFNDSMYGNWLVSGRVERCCTQAVHGEASLAIRGRYEPVMGDAGAACQMVDVVGNEVYEFVFQHRCEDSFTAAQHQVSFSWYDADEEVLGQDIRVIAPVENQDTWYAINPMLVTAKTDAVSARIALEFSGLANTGSYYIEDAFFRKPQDFFQRAGTNILDLTGNPFLIRGMALSGWFFPEAYMFGIAGGYSGHINTHSQMREQFEKHLGTEARAEAFWDIYTTNFLTEADIALLVSKGMNTFRLPFNYRDLSPLNNEGAIREKGFEQMDRVIEWCRSNDVYIILDMHGCPGGQAPVNSGDPEHIYNAPWGEDMVACFWQFDDDYHDRTGRTPESNVKRCAELWRVIAERYRNEPQILGYELINEPYLNGSSDVPVDVKSTNFVGDVIREAFLQVSDAVRQVDDRHLFFVEGDMFAEWIDGLTPPWDDNMALAFHRYWKTNDVDCLDEYLNARDTYQIPLWLSESGENSNPWCRELVDLCDEHDIGWTFWGWKMMDATSAGYTAHRPDNFDYCYTYLWSNNVNADTFETGLVDTVMALLTENCHEQKGYFASMFDSLFGITNQAYMYHSVPGLVNAVDYDIGDQAIAYFDHDYKNETYWDKVVYNAGEVYRNDGVDIGYSDEGCGYVVSYIGDGEWMRYSIDLLHPGIYSIAMRTASTLHTGRIQLYLDGISITPIISIPSSGDWDAYTTVGATSEVSLAAGTHTLECRFIKGSFNLSSVEFQLDNQGYVDYDSDDMDDHWEISLGGDLLPDTDNDNDEMNNRDEYIADTNPTNAYSKLLFETTLLNELDYIGISMPDTSSERVYSVEYSPSLLEQTWDCVVSNMAGSGSGMTLFTTNIVDGYFRIKAALP